MESNLTLASIFPSMLVDMLINTADKCRFIRYAIDVNWSNTSQISKGNQISLIRTIPESAYHTQS